MSAYFFPKELITDICRHLAFPLGIADVACEKLCRSMKTVKSDKPFDAAAVRLISGRCSSDYPYNATDPHADVRKSRETAVCAAMTAAHQRKSVL